MDSQSSPYSSHDPSPEERRLNHMIFPQHIPLPQMNTFSLTETDQLQYDTPRRDYLQANPLPMNLARPDIDMLMQDIDISNFSLAHLDAFCSPQNGSKVNDDIAQFYLQPSDYQNTTAPSQIQSSSSTATSSTYLFDQTLESPVNQGLHPRVLNQGPRSAAPMQQDPAMGTFMWEPIANSLSSMNDGVTTGSMMGSKESSMLNRKKNSNARGFRRRRYHPRHIPNQKAPQSSALGGIKNGTPIPSKTPTMPRDNMISKSMTEVDKIKDDHVDPERALNLLKRSIETQPYSSISQREMSALIKKIEDVVLREKMYGSSSSDSGEVTIPSTVSDSISNSESIEPEYSSDATSMSSTPRLPVDETPDAEATEAQIVHKMNCPHCGNKPNYYCSKRGCGYFAHTRGDAKRHEEGEKHYPQARFMCCDCPLAYAQLNMNGNPICEFCNASCLNSGLLRAHYLHCADAKNLGKTFSRKDHFIQHLREEHNIFNDAQSVVTSRYPIASNWPRQCSRCPKTFQTWEERMKHLAEHAEEDFHPRGFSKKPKDDDDDDDNDDHHGGGGRSQGKGVGRQIKAALPMQHNHASTSFNNAPSSYDNYRSRTQASPLVISEQPVLSRKPSLALERYLNDKESPVLLPLGYQKCESHDTQLVPRTLQNNNSEMRYQGLAASDGTTRPLHASKRSPSPGIPLAAVQDMQDEDAGCIQSTYNNSLRESTRDDRQLLTARTAREKTPSSKMKLSPIYPILIPSDEQESTLQLYVKYKKEVELEVEHTSFHLAPPIITRSVVKSTPACRQISTSISSSTDDGLTDLSSVISFDDRESSSSGKHPLGELVSFDGKTIKRRARKRLSPTAKAKAALIRCLGSCWVCRSRRVPCPLEHHDIEALEGLPSQWESSQTLGSSSDAAHPRAGNNIVVCDAGGGTVDLIPSGSNFAPFHKHASASRSRMRSLRFEMSTPSTPPLYTTMLTSTTLTTPRVGLTFGTGSEKNFISPGIAQKPGILTPQMRFEPTENLALAKFEVGEWPRLESELHYWISGMPNSGKSHLGRIVLNGPWSNKEPTSRLPAQGVRCNHCFTKDLHDLLKPDRKPFQSMRGDDSVSAVSMEIPHVHFKTTDNREQTDPDIAQIDPSITQSKACARIGSYTSDRSGGEEMEKSQSNENSSSSSRSSLTSFGGSDFAPIQGLHPNPQISDILEGASMPTKPNTSHQAGSAPILQSQEMKRRRRRESYNLVERRRRDNINERIQELSHLVSMHRLEDDDDDDDINLRPADASLEDEKIRKALQNNSLLSPTLAGWSALPTGMSPHLATSSLAGLGARRATASNIITSTLVKEKCHGPNKEDILNSAVSWTRELMWMLHLKPQQQENLIADLGGTFPFEESEDERRMYTELVDAMVKNDESTFHSKVFSRIPRSAYGIRANEEFENRLDEALSRTMGENSGAKTKTASTISTMVYTLLEKNTEIIKAASDGDIGRVAKLISRGANVNARDRWGWSALSMCGYGGYLDIARLLLDHGADLEVVDVDGDTPEILAITRGLPDMVKLFREERERLSRVSERGITRLSLARDMEGLFPPAK